MTDIDLTKAIEAGARALDAHFNPDRYPIMAAMFRDTAAAAIEAALPEIRRQLAAQLPSRGEIAAVLNREFGPFLVHDPSQPERFYGHAADAVLELFTKGPRA